MCRYNAVITDKYITNADRVLMASITRTAVNLICTSANKLCIIIIIIIKQIKKHAVC